MVRITFQKVLTDNAPTTSGEYVSYIEAAGLRTDTKPEDGIATGSLFLETDTGDVYAFSEGDSPAWTKIAALGGAS